MKKGNYISVQSNLLLKIYKMGKKEGEKGKNTLPNQIFH